MAITCHDETLRGRLQASAADLRAVARAGELSINAAGLGEPLQDGLLLELRL